MWRLIRDRYWKMKKSKISIWRWADTAGNGIMLYVWVSNVGAGSCNYLWRWLQSLEQKTVIPLEWLKGINSLQDSISRHEIMYIFIYLCILSPTKCVTMLINVLLLKLLIIIIILFFSAFFCMCGLAWEERKVFRPFLVVHLQRYEQKMCTLFFSLFMITI